MTSLYPFITEMFPYRSPSERPASEEVEMEVFSPKVPSVALPHIFGYLPLKDLVSATAVSKVWREVATLPRLWREFDLQKLFPLKVFDIKEWREFVDLSKFHLSFEGVDDIDNRYAIPEIAGFFSELKKKNVTLEGQCQVTLLTIPKGLSLPSLKMMISDPKKGNPMKAKQNFPDFYLHTDSCYRILITNSCLPESEEKEFGELKSLVKKIGCRVPKTLEAITLIGMIHVSSIENPSVSLNLYSLSTACEEEFPKYQRFIRIRVGTKVDDTKGILSIKVKKASHGSITDHRIGRGIGGVKEFLGCMRLPTPTRKTTPKQTASIFGIPNHVFLEAIFRNLTPHELAKSSQVCKRWYTLAFDASLWKAFDLEKLFRLTVFDEKAWKRYADLPKLGATVDDIGPMDHRVVIPQIVRFFARLRKEGVEIEGNGKITLLTVPKDLSVEGLVEFAKAPREGNQKIVFSFSRGCQASRTGRILITDSILRHTRNTSVDFKRRLVEKISCNFPYSFDAMALCVTRYISSPSDSPLCPYPEHPITSTLCEDKVDNRELVVGGFSPTAGGIYFADLCRDDYIGVGAVQTLSESQFNPFSFEVGK